MKSIKAYAADGEHVTIICPHCGVIRQGSLKRIRILSHVFKVRCRCGEPFEVVLELRKSYRKTTFLLGTYTGSSAPGMQGRMVVDNLSLTGIGISLSPPHTLAVGDSIRLRFTLDDPLRTEVEKRAVVRHIHDDYAGCQFLAGGSSTDKALGYYLMP